MHTHSHTLLLTFIHIHTSLHHIFTYTFKCTFLKKQDFELMDIYFFFNLEYILDIVNIKKDKTAEYLFLFYFIL